MEHGTASALVAYSNNQKLHEWSARIPDHATVFQAELYAIQQAIKWHSEQNTNSTMPIHTDSKSSLQALSATNQRNPLVQVIQHQLLNHPDYTLHWVRGHAGNAGNEAADDLAKSATQQARINNTDLKMPQRHVKNLLKAESHEHWQDYWSCEGTGAHTRRFLPLVKHPYMTKTAGQTAFLTGHGPFPVNLHRFHLVVSLNCVCGQDGTALHYIHSRPLTAEWHFVPSPPQTNVFGRLIFSLIVTSYSNLIKHING